MKDNQERRIKIDKSTFLISIKDLTCPSTVLGFLFV
jgi:hypothetical protein